MFTLNRIVIVFGAVAALSCSASAFFLNWGGSDTTPNQPAYYYHQRYLQTPSGYALAGTEPPSPIQVPFPSIPIQVPLQAQLTPASNIHNVQLVPCLCPISQEIEFEKAPPQENAFYGANQQHKNQ